jgi:UDP-N-acetyl-D-galactosamine dehydrogenase
MKNNKICIIGLGYVGLPLAVIFAKKFDVVGVDKSKSRINELNNSYDRTLEVDPKKLDLVKEKIIFTSNIKDAEDCDIYIVTVPTPIDKYNRPDLTPLIESSRAIGKVLTADNIVIYESTVYPGVTEDVCVPELEKTSKLTFNEDFYCGYSPERVNPGDREHTAENIIKVTSGSTPFIAKKVDNLYNQVLTAGTHMASSIKVAEASKVIENTQRDVNIALINELALIFNQMNIDTNEVIEAASTKWNFIKLQPGLVGGHCIGVDPYYLTFKSEELGYKPDLILASRQINNSMGKYIADQTIREMINAGKKIKDAQVLILGITFKENCPDMRNSKVLDIIAELKKIGTKVDVYDPCIELIERDELRNYGLIHNPIKGNKKYDAIVVAVSHNQFKKYTEKDYSNMSNGESIVIDVKNIVDNPTWKL